MKETQKVFRCWVAGAALLPYMCMGAPATAPQASSVAPAAPPAEKVATAQMNEPWSQALSAGRLNLGLHFGDQQSESFGDLVLPIAAFRSGLLFVNPRGTWNDDDGQEFNLGLGYRHLFPKQNIIAGANVYYDLRNSSLDNTFNQFGAGLEFLSTWVDARANVYLPENSKKTSDSYVVAEGKVQEYGSYWEDPSGSGHQISQYGYEVNNTYDVKNLLHYQMTEQAMQGFDAEIGALLPIPVIRNFADVKVFGGMYDYNAHYGDDIIGMKGRLEIHPLPALYLDAAWYEDRALIGSRYSVGLRASLPFDLANLSSGKNPFAGALDGFKPGVRKVPFASRLTEMVVRDLHIRTDASQPEEIETDRRQLEKTLVASERKDYNVVLASDVTFVDDDNRSGKEDGSWENPYRQINTGVQQAIGKMVYVRDAAQQYYENVVLRDGLTLWGSGAPIYGRGNRYLGGVYPVVNGMGSGPAITLASHTTVAGFEIIQSGHPPVNPAPGGGGNERVGIFGESVSDVNLLHNYIHGSSVFPGVMLMSFLQPELRANISDNRIEGVGDDGVMILTAGDDLVDLTLANNRITGCGNNGIYISAIGFNAGSCVSRISGVMSGNRGDGVDLNITGFNEALAFFVDTEANDNQVCGIRAFMTQNDLSAVLVASHTDLERMNQLVNTVLNDVPLLSGLVGTSVDLADMLGVRGLYRSGGATSANGNGGVGITVFQIGEENLALTGILGVQADGNGMLQDPGQGHGIQIEQVGLIQDAVTLIARTEANGNHANGISVNSTAQSLALNVLMDVTANQNGEKGIGSYAFSPDGAAGTIVFSSDPLVSLISTLSANPLLSDYVNPMDLSFIPAYGQVQVNQNGGSGLSINSIGTNVAFALVLDTQANYNGQDPAQHGRGIDISVNSEDGLALAVAGSSEALVNLASPLLQAFSLPVDLSGVTTLGPLQAIGNHREGLDISVVGQNTAIGLVGGAEILNNGLGGDTGPAPGYSDAGGLRLDVVSIGSGALAGLGWIDASGNRGEGIRATVRSDDADADAMLGGIHIRADNNTGGGVFASVASASPDSAYLVLAGIEANNNTHSDGINVTLSGEGALMAALSGVTANGNGHNGVTVRTDSVNGGSHVWISGTAIEDMISHGGGIDLMGVDINSLLPTGAIVTENNAAAGISINANSPGGSVLVDVGDATTTGNTLDGVRADMSAHDGIQAAFHDIDTAGSGGGVVFTTNNITGTVSVNLSGITP